jgi:AraC-like DNA-binding protein
MDGKLQHNYRFENTNKLPPPYVRINNLYCCNNLKSWYLENDHKIQAGNNLKEDLYRLFFQYYLSVTTVEKQANATIFAKELALSLRSLQRKLKEETGLTFCQHHLLFRLDQSKKLLQQGYSRSDISDILCFSSPAYFAYCFKKKFNLTPSCYIAEVEKEKLRS